MPTTGTGHRNICCDGCQRLHFHGRRFKCLRCSDYDLCGDCYDQQIETRDHRAHHPMQLIMENGEVQPEVMINGDLLELIHLPNCYTCPYCGVLGHTAKQLIEHVITTHRSSNEYVVCPLCCGLPSIELVAIRNLARHLVLNHIEHANILDPNTPPLRLAIARSSRRHRRQQEHHHHHQEQLEQSQPYQQPQPQPQRQRQRHEPDMDLLNMHDQSSRSRRRRGRFNSESNIVQQLHELSRNRPDLLPTVEMTEEEFMNTDFSAIAAALEARTYSAHRPVNRDERPIVPALALPILETPSEAPCRPDADRYLLTQWINKEKERNQHSDEMNSQKQQHGLFAEHILLSMMGSDELKPFHTKESLYGEDPSKMQSLMTSFNMDKQDDSPSKAMSLMSLPWTRIWKVSKINQVREIEGVAIDESKDEKANKFTHHERYENKEEDID
ncbi:E3 ubiquitin-protein ligase KCMF1-like [Drosophila tropicalis]|uniref:E3 ubiquitin-protein ligase KCMF1-like n=1 Tax=Drosophila tropicalis TaxID=46794 RepID=UPI0035ABBDC4